MRLTVMSFNVRYGTAADGPDAWPRRRDLVADVVREWAPDVLGAQEVLPFQRAFLLQALEGMAAVGVGREPGGAGEQCCILYRADRLEVLDEGTFWLSEAPETPGSRGWDADLPRICTWARLRARQGGRTLSVYNTHLDHRGSLARLESARLLRDRIARRPPGEPVLVMGDMNATPGSPPLAWLGEALDDALERQAPDGLPGTFHGFRGPPTRLRIDHILVDPGAAVRETAIVRDARDGRHPSDHFPVLARLDLVGAADPGRGGSPRQR